MESKNVNAHKRRYHRSPSASAKRHKYHSTDLRPKPYFDTRIDKETGFGARNITTVEGGRAIFICRIRQTTLYFCYQDSYSECFWCFLGPKNEPFFMF